AGLLSSFNGMDAMGDWTLSVIDADVGDTGSLQSWSVTLTPLLPACPGACCVGTACSEVSSSDCLTAGGEFQAGATCATTSTCIPPAGACCAANGDCAYVPLSFCNTSGGDYRGQGVTCSPNPCVGGCCSDVGVCTLETPA